MTAIIASATAISAKAGPRSSSEIRELAADIMTSGERLNRVVENILDMTRLNAGAPSLKKDWQDVRDLIGVCLRKLDRNLAKHGVTVKVEEGLELIEIDFRLMEHLLSNLIFNATAYTPPGTEIQVKAAILDKRIRLSVEDDGPGVPPGDLQRIFEKFYRAPGAPTGGTGLGLAISRRFCEMMGAIWAEAREKGGLRLVVDLPLGVPPKVAPLD